MWGLFGGKPACPVDDEMRRWVDGRFQWLGEQLGHDVPRTAEVVLPTPEFFPDAYAGRPDDAVALFVRVAGYMGVDPERFELFVYTGDRPPSADLGHGNTSSAAGLYVHEGGVDAQGRPCAAIGIEESQLADPMSLVATLAHEIGHEILLGQGRVSPDQQDHEPLTDLLTVFKGMGVFLANSTIHDRGWSQGTWVGWQTRRLGYLDQRAFGYALARFAWARGETRPPWIHHVRPDVRAPLKQGLRFLAEP
jgi:hypothetical protein